MSADLVTRLRAMAMGCHLPNAAKTAGEAADEIERLRALLTAVSESGCEWRTPGYVLVQIDKATWSAINTWSAIAAARKPVQASISAVSGFDFPPEGA